MYQNSVVDPADRFTFYRGLMHLHYGKDPAKVYNFLKVRWSDPNTFDGCMGVHAFPPLHGV